MSIMSGFAHSRILATQLCFALAIPSLTSALRADTLFYGGDPQNGGAAYLNQYNYTSPDVAHYVNFIIPTDETWEISGLFANTVYNLDNAFPQNSPQNTQALYEIRSGVSAGNEGTLLSSGTASAIPVPMGFSYAGYNGFRIEVAFPASVSLSTGSYWAAIVPIGSGNEFAFMYPTDGVNRIGPIGNQSNFFTIDAGPFDPDPYAYSLGVRGHSVPNPPGDGDFNEDGFTDAADYVAWRKGLATGATTPDDYNTWKQNFGATTTGAVGVAPPEYPVPEPTSVILFAMLVVMRIRPAARSCLMAITLAILAVADFRAGTADAADFTFTNVADTTTPAPTGTFTSFSNPAISGNKVVFFAEYPGMFVNYGLGMFYEAQFGAGYVPLIQGGDSAPIAPGYIFTSAGVAGPALNSSGQLIAFHGDYCGVQNNLCVFNTYGDGIFVSGPTRGPAQVVVKKGDPAPSGTFTDFNYSPAISDGLVANLAYMATFGANQSGVFLAPIGGGGSVVAKTGDPAPMGGTFTGFGGSVDNPVAISGERVAFWAYYTGGTGIFSGDPFGLTTIAKTGDPRPGGATFTGFGPASISGSTVAFLGSASGTISGVYAGDGGPLTSIVESGDAAPVGTFLQFHGDVSISGGDVAFVADYGAPFPGTSYTGVFVGDGTQLKTVIKQGDPLFGSTVLQVNSSPLAIGKASLDPTGSGQLAFSYQLADGRIGIAVATPTPEPNGDFNGDDSVDAADYVAWRKGVGVESSPDNYNAWRTHFGEVVQSGAATSADLNAFIPEPTPVQLITIAWLLMLARSMMRRRIHITDYS
jgi:hypothetical protein